MRLLITGSNGLLGQKIVKQCLAKGIDFLATSKGDNRNQDCPNVKFLSLDISNPLEVKKVFDFYYPTHVIHTAAITNVDYCEDHQDECQSVNVDATRYLVQASNTYKTHFQLLSTDFVFDGKKQEPYNEEDSTNPLNVYGASKLAGEKHVEAILPSHFIIRTSWLYSVYGKNFVKTIISKIKEKKKLQIVTTQVGTPTSCIDLSEFIYFLIKSKTLKFGLYNFSALGQASWYEFAKQIQTHFKNTQSEIIPINSFPSKAIRPKYSVLNNNKAKKIVTVIPDWKESVDKVVLKLKDAKY